MEKTDVASNLEQKTGNKLDLARTVILNYS